MGGAAEAHRRRLCTQVLEASTPASLVRSQSQADLLLQGSCGARGERFAAGWARRVTARCARCGVSVCRFLGAGAWAAAVSRRRAEAGQEGTFLDELLMALGGGAPRQALAPRASLRAPRDRAAAALGRRLRAPSSAPSLLTCDCGSDHGVPWRRRAELPPGVARAGSQEHLPCRRAARPPSHHSPPTFECPPHHSPPPNPLR